MELMAKSNKEMSHILSVNNEEIQAQKIEIKRSADFITILQGISLEREDKINHHWHAIDQWIELKKIQAEMN